MENWPNQGLIVRRKSWDFEKKKIGMNLNFNTSKNWVIKV